MARPPSNERTTPTHPSHHHFTVTTSQYTMKIGMHAKVTALVLLLAKDFLVTQAHFIWQQTVADSNGESTSTMITFAENPGLAQAGVERFAHMVHEKGMHVYMKGIEDYDSLKEISTSQVGKYIKGQLPDSITKSQDGKSLSYALEGFCRWGVWAEGGPPSLLLYYTSASHIDKPSDRRKEKNASQNIFRLSLYLEDKQSLCEGTIDSDSSALQLLQNMPVLHFLRITLLSTMVIPGKKLTHLARTHKVWHMCLFRLLANVRLRESIIILRIQEKRLMERNMIRCLTGPLPSLRLRRL